jgi:hypothetical protein
MYRMMTDVTVISADCAMTGDCMLTPGLLLWVACILLRSVDRSVRRGRLGVCPECQMAEVGKSWTITKSVQRSDG